ncbi:hypothetical protein C5167_032955, partial [Papaver somniferum]
VREELAAVSRAELTAGLESTEVTFVKIEELKYFGDQKSIEGQDEFVFHPQGSMNLIKNEIKPEMYRYEVMSTKIEMRLAKAEAIN